MRPSIDEASLERQCIRLLQDVDHDGQSVVCPGGRFDASAAMVASMGWMYLDLERAVVELEGTISAQRGDGRIAPEPGAAGFCLPALASFFRMIYHAARGRQRTLEPRLAELVAPLDRFHQALVCRDKRRLSVYTPDDARVVPRTSAPACDLMEPGLDALLTQAESDLADVAIHTGYPTRAIVARRTHRAQALAEGLWDAERGCFAARTPDGQWQPARLEDQLPLWAGAALRHQAAELFNARLTPGRGYWTAFPLATGPRGDVADGSDQATGPVDPLLNWLLVRGLYRYGFDDGARELSEATLVYAADHGMHQSYDCQTGEPVGSPNWAPTAAVVLDLLKTPHTYNRW